VTYAEAESLLLDLPRFTDQGALALRPGLERIDALLEGMGRPDRSFASVHVAGTNGKGSTASMLAAVSTASGARTGLHTSPHLHTLRERMRVDGVPAGEGWVAGAMSRFRDLVAAVEPSFFEATVALSFLYFAEQAVDLAVVEVGLGGRWDATNVLVPRLALITRIARDHTDLLGDDLADIAREKAGIAKPGVPLLTAVEAGPALEAIRREAASRGGRVLAIRDEVSVNVHHSDASGVLMDLQTPVRRYDGLRLALAGSHQAWNAALAVRAAEYVVPAVGRSAVAVREGLARVYELSGLRGRCEVLNQDPLIIGDVAHNADGLRVALGALAHLAAGERCVILGLMQDKDIDEMADLLAREGVDVIPVHLPGRRALSADMLRDRLAAHGVNVRAPDSVHDAIAGFRARLGDGAGALVTGSHVTVAAARTALGLADA
jgi:dihydrofolate synthase / folylpolyglutamate synthase